MSRLVLGLLLLCLAAGAQTTGPLETNRKPRLPRVDEPLPKRPTDQGPVGQRSPNEVVVIEDEPEKAPSEAASTVSSEPSTASGEREVSAVGSEPVDPGPPVLRRRSDGQNADSARHADQPFPNEPPAGGFPPPPELDPLPAETATVAPGTPADADGRPTLRRAPAPAARLHSDPVIAQAMEANLEFSQSLPNFICDQLMKRAITPNMGKTWESDGNVTAEVLVIDGVENYQSIKVNGEPFEGKMMEIAGTRSAGEYGSVLWNLFDPSTRADFKRGKPATIRDKEAFVYEFFVQKARSRWTVIANGRTIVPAYNGRVWIEKGTGRALRIEMQAFQLPSDYPVSTAESEIDFADVAIGDNSYLLPVEAGNLSCQNGGATCYRNQIFWTHHRKFEAVSSVFETDSVIDFGGQAAEGSAEGQGAQVEGGQTQGGQEQYEPPQLPKVPDPK
ncbi:MAG: hypothetical protein GC160_24570 [Acidobacteria bacterium]|nr:hypothetical protein [Acidobacteriota bacterium]